MRLCQFLSGLLQTFILAADQKTPVLAEFLMELVKDTRLYMMLFVRYRTNFGLRKAGGVASGPCVTFLECLQLAYCVEKLFFGSCRKNSSLIEGFNNFRYGRIPKPSLNLTMSR